MPRSASLAVASRSHIGLKNRDVLHSYATVGYAAQPNVCLVIKILCQIFGRRIENGEGLDVVNHLVIETINGVLHDVFQILEIEQQSGLIEFGTGESHTNLIV